MNTSMDRERNDEWWLFIQYLSFLVSVTSNGELKLPVVNRVEFSTNLMGTVSWLQGSNGVNITVSTSKYVC